MALLLTPTGKIDAVTESSTPERQAPRDRFKTTVTRWLLGGDFHVVSVASDSERATVEYVLPPRQLEPFPESAQPPLNQGLLANIDHIVHVTPMPGATYSVRLQNGQVLDVSRIQSRLLRGRLLQL